MPVFPFSMANRLAGGLENETIYVNRALRFVTNVECRYCREDILFFLVDRWIMDCYSPYEALSLKKELIDLCKAADCRRVACHVRRKSVLNTTRPVYSNGCVTATRVSNLSFPRHEIWSSYYFVPSCFLRAALLTGRIRTQRSPTSSDLT